MDMYDIQNEYEYAYDGEGCYDYESESDYESDYGDEEYADNDDAWANRDDEYDSVLSRTCVSEKPSLDKAVGMTVLAKPVQLAAKTSSFKTMMEAKFAAADKAKKEAADKELADRLAEQRVAEDKMKEELRLRAMVAHLPTESRAAKERRLKKEAEEKAKAAAKAKDAPKATPKGKAKPKAKRARNKVSLREAVTGIIKGKPLDKKSILAELEKSGYKFSTKNPMNSLNVVLYTGKYKRADGKFSA
mgnify:CR=1 FL=1